MSNEDLRHELEQARAQSAALLQAERDRLMQRVRHLLQQLTDAERLDVFGPYCRFCGRADPGCQCWNDE